MWREGRPHYGRRSISKYGALKYAGLCAISPLSTPETTKGERSGGARCYGVDRATNATFRIITPLKRQWTPLKTASEPSISLSTTPALQNKSNEHEGRGF